MLLGAIIKEMDKAGLNIIAFKAPFDGFSVHAVLHSIYSFQDHRWYDSNEGHCLHPCDLRNEIKLGRKPTHDDYGILLSNEGGQEIHEPELMAWSEPER